MTGGPRHTVLRATLLLISCDRFDFYCLDERHLLALARGPLEDAAESYQAAAWGYPGMERAARDETAHQRLLNLPLPSSELKSLREIVDLIS